MSLAPDSCGCHTQDTSNGHTTQMICCEQRRIFECYAKQDSDRDGVGGQQWRRNCRNDTDEAKDADDYVALP